MTRPFTQIEDDLIRSPHLNATELRLYEVMKTYCKKTAKRKVCTLPQDALAVIMRISLKTVGNGVRKLEELKLIRKYRENGNRAKTRYEILQVPDDICPEDLKGSKFNDVLEYIKKTGGVRANQRRKLPPRAKPKRVGWKKTAKRDDAKVPDVYGCVETDIGNQLPMRPVIDYVSHTQPITDASVIGYVSHTQPITDVIRNQLPPVKEEEEEDSLERPNGLENEGDIRHLVLRTFPPGEVLTRGKNIEEHRVRRAAQNDQETDVMAKESDEQKEARLARLKALRGGNRNEITDIRKPTAEAAPKRMRGAGRPPSSKDDTQAVLEKHLTVDPDKLSATPGSPWPLYGHFCREVRKTYPDARLPNVADGQYLKWGKILLDKFSREDLYEMIRILVLDYKNIRAANLFLKGTMGTLSPYPTYALLYMNADTLVTFVGVGILSPPAVRFSPYSEDYNRRHNKSATNTTNGDGSTGKTTVDPIQALRDRLNG